MSFSNKSYSFFNHKSTIWIPIFLVLLVLCTLLLYLNFPSGYNQGIYHYQGLVLKNGGLPYSDFIEKKGPMGLLTYALASIIFGETVIGYRIFDILILTITAFFLFRLSKLKYSKSISFLVVVFWLQHILIDGPGNTADVTNIITACYVAIAYYLLATNVKNRCLIIGFAIALAGWVKPTALLIALPLLFLVFKRNELYHFNKKSLFQFLLGMGIPTIIFMAYLVLSDTFYAFWEVVVLDTLYNYSGYVSRFSYRVLFKIGWTFLNDPILRIGGLLGLFIFSKNSIIKLIVIGIGLMLFVEGRLYPYQFSILWPFLTLGLIEIFLVLSSKLSQHKQKILMSIFCILMTFPLLKTGSNFIQAGFLTSNFDAAETFIFPDFKIMYRQRKSVVAYLKKQLNPKDEILVLGRDPNIYLELGVITTCRLAREGFILTEKLTSDTPSHLIDWQKELLKYMEDEKADWIIVLKELQNTWITAYSNNINNVFSKKYELEHTTEGHLIYKKI